MSTAPQYRVRGLDLHKFPMRWVVESDKDKYIVDLDSSSCTCSHYVFRLSKRDRDVDRRCKHILMCRERLADFVISDRKSC